MLRSYTFIAFLFFVLISCNNIRSDSEKYHLRDSVAKEHIERHGDMYDSDTSNINYKVLKAYLANDTSYFRDLHYEIIKQRKWAQQWENNDTCIHQRPLNELDAEEAYRFVHTASFCDYKLNVTISQIADSANIHFILYQDVWLNSICKIINEYDKRISPKNWNNFSELMRKADFWGLKGSNGRSGLDGSTLVVTGFARGDNTYEKLPKFNFVYRWGLSTLDDPFTFVLKLSGNKQGCFWVE